MIMQPTCTNLPALHAEFILGKLKIIFAFGIIYYDNTVPADDLTTHKKGVSRSEFDLFLPEYSVKPHYQKPGNG